MKLEFERTIEDVIDFNLFHMAHSPSIKRQLLTYRILLSLLIILAPPVVDFLLGRSTSTFGYMYGLVVGTVIFIVYPYITRSSTIRRIRKMLGEGDNKAMVGHCAMTFSPEGIFTKTANSESKIDWSAVIKIVQNEKHVFLYIGSINACVIPKSAFANYKAKQEFLDYVSVNTRKEVIN